MPPVPKPKDRQRRPHFFRTWRKHRGYTIETAAEMIGMSRENLGRIERGEVPYDQDWLELAAQAYRCEPADLLLRDPTDPEGLWSLWDQVKPAQRRQAIELLRVIIGGREAA